MSNYNTPPTTRGDETFQVEAVPSGREFPILSDLQKKYADTAVFATELIDRLATAYPDDTIDGLRVRADLFGVDMADKMARQAGLTEEARARLQVEVSGAAMAVGNLGRASDQDKGVEDAIGYVEQAADAWMLEHTGATLSERLAAQADSETLAA